MIKITKYTPVNRAPLVGFLDIEIDTWFVEIRGITIVQKDGKRWFNLPSKEYEKDDGSKGYAPIIKFTSEAVDKKFKTALRQSFDEYCASAVTT